MGDALRWSNKHLKLKGEGARVVHIQQLLKQQSKLRGDTAYAKGIIKGKELVRQEKEEK